MSRQTARKALERRLRRGGSWFGPTPDTLKLSEIGTLEEVFQFRKPLPHKGEAHKRNLGRSMERKGGALGRLLVYWAGDGWVCIDGHHRLAAYQRKKLQAVPVEAFTGPLHEAVKQALMRNNEAKLPMEERERTEAAWDLVAAWDAEFSKSEIADTAGVSTSVVGNMRRIRGLLQAEHPRHDLSDLTWWQARELAKGSEPLPSDGGDEKRTAAIRDKLIKAFGHTLSKRPDLLAAALRDLDEDLPGALREAIEDMDAKNAEWETEGNPAGGGPLPFPTAPNETEGADF